MLQHVPVVTMIDHQRWTAVLARDSAADGTFYYAVTSTGVFCRPSCPSRRPSRERVRFFDSPAAAERAGYRPCRRCHPTAAANAGGEPIARVAAYLNQHGDEPVPLAKLARIARLSPAHLQRRFKRALGLSPREYQAAVRAGRFRASLRRGDDVTTATYAAGYGSPSRVYEAAPTGRGVAPSAYRRGAAGVAIGFATARSPLGYLLVAGTEKGVCAVKLGENPRALEADLRREFPGAAISPDRSLTVEWMRAILEQLRGSKAALDLPLDVRGTAFQWRVWQALRDIPFGATRSYSDVARAIGRPTAVRAVARACAANRVCLVVPCHRVVGKNGALGGYRWGAARKRRLLDNESA